MEHRADAVFALPELPATAMTFGELPAWERDLAERGVELVSRGPDLAVASPEAVPEALASGAPSVIVDGGRRAAHALRRRGLAATRLLPVPLAGSPLLYLPTDFRLVTSYGLRHGISHAELWRALRNRATAGLARLGALPPLDGIVTLGARRPGPPELVAAAGELGARVEAAWLMVVSSGSVVRRNALLLFPPGAREPAQAIKFSRVAGETGHFDREERGLVLAARAGGSLASRAPDYLGRGELRGRPFSVESAGRGAKLSTLLRLPGPRRRKLAVLDAVAGWLVEVGRETAASPPALRPELDRLAREVLPLWRPDEVSPELVAGLPAVPATFQHNDVAEENVIVARDGFTVIDWEWVEPRGVPLGDVVYFGCRVLRLLDGALAEEDRDAHFEALVTGRAASSPILFRWVRGLVDALALPPEAVGPLVTLSWLDQASVSARERRRAEVSTGRSLDPDWAERCASTWLRHPRLGADWRLWRDR